MQTHSRAVAVASTNALTHPVGHSEPAGARRHYADLEGWQRYQDFFPPSMRCTATTTPSEEWWTWNGIDVHLDRSPVPESPIKVIVLHGAGAYGRVMAPAAVIARRHGYETVSPDLPGYGLTRVSSKQMTYSLWIDCVCALIDAELARDGRPVVLFGVSLGGLLAYHAAARSRRIVGLVATTLADPREPAVRQGFARTALTAARGSGCSIGFACSPTGCPCRCDTCRR